jgi:hypothetical protein
MKSPGADDRGLRALAGRGNRKRVYKVDDMETRLIPRPARAHWLESPFSGGFTTG